LSPVTAERPYREAAKRAADWLVSVGEPSPHGTRWGEDESLYAGTPGVLLFFLHAARAYDDPQYLAHARSGGDHLLASLSAFTPDRESFGLYTGLAGTAYALHELAESTQDQRYADGVAAAVRILRETGAPWTEWQDIIFGTAGIVVVLLQLGESDLAVRGADDLLLHGTAAPGGLDWPAEVGQEYRMPNLSHGTAGVAYALARTYAATGEQRFLDAAIAGAGRLVVFGGSEDGFLAPHGEPAYEPPIPISYGWCHGPAGTSRLFTTLADLDAPAGEVSWSTWVDRAARTVRRSGIPERREPEFWDNLAQCCGSAGVAEWFLSLHGRDPSAGHLDFTLELVADILARGISDEDGLRWSNTGADGNDLPPEPGWSQGAAGIGSLLIRLDTHLQGREHRLAWPDSPY